MKPDAEGCVRLRGQLTSREVPGLYRDSLPWRKTGVPQTIDLGEVDKADSSALALLLEWRSWADSAGQPIRFIGVPRSLCVMASLSQIEALLGWRTLDFEAEGDTGQCCA